MLGLAMGTACFLLILLFAFFVGLDMMGLSFKLFGKPPLGDFGVVPSKIDFQSFVCILQCYGCFVRDGCLPEVKFFKFFQVIKVQVFGRCDTQRNTVLNNRVMIENFLEIM